MLFNGICGRREPLDSVTLGAVVREFHFELSVVIVLVTIRTVFVGYQESGGKLRSQRSFVALFTFHNLVFAFKPVIGKRMIKTLYDKRSPGSRSVARFAVSAIKSGIVGRLVARGAIIETQRRKRHELILPAIHLRVALFTLDFGMRSKQRKPGGRVIKRHNDGPARRRMARPARLTGEFPPVR